MTALLKERRMFLGILVVLSCLSISALGQTVTTPTECTNAVTTFTQSMECFGTQTGLNGFLALLNSTSGSTDITRNAALNSAERQALAIFYNNFCTKQACINAYANAYQPCYDAQFRQVCIIFASLLLQSMETMQKRLLLQPKYLPISKLASDRISSILAAPRNAITASAYSRNRSGAIAFREYRSFNFFVTGAAWGVRRQ